MGKKSFKPAWWLRNKHLQTIWPALCRRDIKNLTLERERLELPDGDFLDLEWAGKNESGPLIIVLHGFEGSIDSHYARGMLQSIRKQGWRGVFMHFRGCSGEPNRLPRGYHSGETGDLDYLVRVLQRREHGTPMAAVGYSLGGNVLLKWLGETGDKNPLKAAIAISVPFDLHKACKRMESGLSRAYQWYLLKFARNRLTTKFTQFMGTPLDPASLDDVRSMRELDHKYTVPLHGFSSVDEYYTTASSGQYLADIKIPTLVLHAKDDPFMTEDVIPPEEKISEQVTMEVSESGGHVGFVSGNYPWRPEYWLEQRVPEFLRIFLS